MLIKAGVDSFEPTYEELKQDICEWIANAIKEFWAYLWGIETHHAMANLNTLLSFEPTYEELKPDVFTSKLAPGCSFEPTYEELKL